MTRFYFGFIWVGQIQVFLLMVSQMWTNFLYEHSIRGADSHQQSSVWYLPFSVKRENSKVETWGNVKFKILNVFKYVTLQLKFATCNCKFKISYFPQYFFQGILLGTIQMKYSHWIVIYSTSWNKMHKKANNKILVLPEWTSKAGARIIMIYAAFLESLSHGAIMPWLSSAPLRRFSLVRYTHWRKVIELNPCNHAFS